MQGPIDYWSRLNPADIGKAFDDSFQGGLQRNVQQAQQQRQLQLQQLGDAALKAAITNPNAKTYSTALMLNPQMKDAIKSSYDTMHEDQRNTNIRQQSSIYGLLTAGNIEGAKGILQARIDADKKAGQPTADDEAVLAQIDEDPTQARAVVGLHLAGAMGPEKFADVYGKLGDEDRANAKLPGDIAKTTADATKAQADATKSLEEARQIAPNAVSGRAVDQAKVRDYQSQIQYRAEALSLDRDKLETTTGLELEKMAQAREQAGRTLSGTAEQAMTSAVVAAEGSRQQATRAADLAEKIRGATLSGGWGAWLAQNAQGVFGNPNLLRKEYATLINSQAVKNLPPGPASDKDIKLALQGFPPPTANAETMASFLSGMAKIQTMAANREQARADWISENGNLGKARHDITVNGVKVPAGANWSEFSTSQAAAERRAAPPERSYMRFGNGQR